MPAPLEQAAPDVGGSALLFPEGLVRHEVQQFLIEEVKAGVGEWQFCIAKQDGTSLAFSMLKAMTTH